MRDLMELCRGMCREELLEQAKRLATQERALLHELLARMSVIDEFSFFKPYPSMFEYARRELGFSEAVAFGRIRVARLARRVPAILVHIREGTMPISHFERISGHVTPDNLEKVIAEVRSLSSRDLERYVADLQPQPTPGDIVRALPAPALEVLPHEEPLPTGLLAPFASSPAVAPPRVVTLPPRPPADEVEWLSGSVTLFRFGADAAFREMFEKARDLLRRRHERPSLAEVFGEALRAFLAKSDPGAGPDRGGKMTGTRRVPKWVKRKVWRRDGGRCTFVGPDGRRCGATAYLEFHHRVPWAAGGRSDDPNNLCLLCGSHHRALGDDDSARAESVDKSGAPPGGGGPQGP